MKSSIILVAITFAICSCNTSREGCYTGKVFYPQNELKVASALPIPNSLNGYSEEDMMQVPRINSEEIRLSTDNITPAGFDEEARQGEQQQEEILLAMAPVQDDKNKGATPELRTVMADNLRMVALTVDNRLVKRFLNKDAQRIEKMNFATTQHSGFLGKIKSKISNKFLTAYAARGGGMAGADILAIVSLVTGIFAFAYYAAFPLGVAAIVTGAIALSMGTDRRGMAIVGIVFGAIAIAFWSGFIVVA